MRQSTRAITDRTGLVAILDGCDVCRLGFCDNDRPYVVPVNFGYAWPDSGLVLYFHGAAEGRKLDLIHRNNQVCFEMDWQHMLRPAEKACHYSMNFESLIGEGLIEIVTDTDEKRTGLDRIMAHVGRADCTYDDRVLARTCVLRLRVTQLSGKRLDK